MLRRYLSLLHTLHALAKDVVDNTSESIAPAPCTLSVDICSHVIVGLFSDVLSVIHCDRYYLAVVRVVLNLDRPSQFVSNYSHRF